MNRFGFSVLPGKSIQVDSLSDLMAIVQDIPNKTLFVKGW
jgi:hypothetical protein